METKEYVILLRATRPTFLKDASNDEKATVAEHYEYWKERFNSGILVLAGPYLDRPDGIIIFNAATPEDAAGILRQDPAILAGVFEGELHPFYTSLHQKDSPPQHVENPTDRLIRYEVHVQATLDEVWRAWTTVEGVKSFFAFDARIEMKIGGAYEIYFDSEERGGLRGSEGCQVLSFLPKEMLSFSWNAPPEYPEIRERRTRVILNFRQLQDGRIRVNLAHYGFDTGEKWDAVWNYFNIAWSHVMDQFLRRFAEGHRE
ncbi:MAG: SRPBCC domain-containing protein [Candidatus Eisenbacteria bacterium]|uniref:SRPBCC domain-containing protein n=1 Tax=Eiseniibacteriota bacterium TaxID=2212470 RepID=A0A948W8G7_UNCEI|nr:SRPBCC domain-containing protein [Candidatus Eisenbacteria bacterium]MBU1948656.1 SRPBCC domain-containing protein [Candidatus Eisenbacteria bacterium]MBU2693310.1 SRPBCC domain-containing protein [Candidatus Eisenbacteria bacterium]